MLNHNNHNSSCNYAEQLVSFIYGEISDSEKNVFEAHLQNCSICADEAASFGFVRSSIQEWRAEDFAKLATPAIEINSLQKTSTFSGGWLKSIRAFLSPSTIGMATGFAAVLIVAGLFWFLGNFRSDNSEIAGNRGGTNQNVALKTNEKSIEFATEMKPETRKNEEIVKTPKPTTQVPKNSQKEINSPVRSVQLNAANQPANKLKNSVATSSNKINNKSGTRTPKKNNVPSLPYDEYEDKSLRLSDLLEEVSLN